jgi:hypothetical protein
MASKSLIGRLRNEFSFLKEENVLGVLLFGSRAKGEKGARDTDICIVVPGKNCKEVMGEVYKHMDVGAKKYDVYCFEELPLYLRWEIIDNHRIIWSRNEGDLYEYFYYFRKLQAEQKHRMELTKKDVLGMLRASAARG